MSSTTGEALDGRVSGAQLGAPLEVVDHIRSVPPRRAARVNFRPTVSDTRCSVTGCRADATPGKIPGVRCPHCQSNRPASSRAAAPTAAAPCAAAARARAAITGSRPTSGASRRPLGPEAQRRARALRGSEAPAPWTARPQATVTASDVEAIVGRIEAGWRAPGGGVGCDQIAELCLEELRSLDGAPTSSSRERFPPSSPQFAALRPAAEAGGSVRAASDHGQSTPKAVTKERT